MDIRLILKEIMSWQTASQEYGAAEIGLSKIEVQSR